MKKFFRLPLWLLLASIVLAILVPTLIIFSGAVIFPAHASGTLGPTIASSVQIAHPNEKVTITGQGFAAQDKVNVLLDDPTYGTPVGTIPCDDNGNCSGNVKMPSNPGLQGQHLLYGVSFYAQGIAQTTQIFNPGLTSTRGGSGTVVQLSGASFTAHETVQIYFGTSTGTHEGSAITDTLGAFSFSFTAPSGLAPGSYPITVTRSNKLPKVVTTRFVVFALTFTSSAGIRSGQPTHIQGTGFQALENIIISWNANGGQTLATFPANQNGAFDTHITPPSAPLGSYTLTARGTASGLQTTSPMNVGPGILLSPYFVNPGGPLTVNGGGYTPGETVDVYVQNRQSGVTPVTVDATGAFTVSLAAPTSNTTTTQYVAYAVNTTGTEHAKTALHFIRPTLNWIGTDPYNPFYTPYGFGITLSGQGFQANEQVKLLWNYHQGGQVQVGTATAAQDGTFSFTTTVPGTPAQDNAQNANIAAAGTTSQLKALNIVPIYPNLLLAPPTAPPGATVKVNGGDFASNETVTVSLNGTTLTTATTDTMGAFHTTFVVPTSTPFGYVGIQAVGSSSGVTVFGNFSVTPPMKISPTTGPSGTVISVTGKQFSTSTTLTLQWFDPTTQTFTFLSSATTTSTGSFKTTVTAPGGLVSGQTYYVEACDPNTELCSAAAFVAQ